MNLIDLMKKILPYVKPYKWLVMATLFLTLIGSLIAQVNAIVLDWTVDKINALVKPEGFEWAEAANILTLISAILLGKEILSALITYAQHFFGEKMRILVSKDMSQAVVDRILTYKMAFFSANENETGKLQTRIDQGVSSLSSTVQNVFIDLLPLFTSAFLALILMFMANFYVGLTALFIVPIYIWITVAQARKLQGWRQNMRGFREQKSHGIMGIIESMNVIKSFNRESIESEKQWNLQTKFTDNQMLVRKTSFYYDGLKSFVRQVGTVLIIILTAYLVLIQYPGMSIGKIMYHVMLFANVTAPITQLQRIFDQLNDAVIYAEGFFDILDADNFVEPSGKYHPENRYVVYSSIKDTTVKPGTIYYYKIKTKKKYNGKTYYSKLSKAIRIPVVNVTGKYKVSAIPVPDNPDEIIIGFTSDKYNGVLTISQSDWTDGTENDIRALEYSYDNVIWESMEGSKAVIEPGKTAYIKFGGKGIADKDTFSFDEECEGSFVSVSYDSPVFRYHIMSVNLEKNTAEVSPLYD